MIPDKVIIHPVPLWQRPASFPRNLPREWKRPAALTGAALNRPSLVKRAIKFACGVLLILILFFEINLLFTPAVLTAAFG